MAPPPPCALLCLRSGKAPTTEDEKTLLIDTLQDYKSQAFQDLIGCATHRLR
jgi:hypothetical protein